jgi:hypothetical protein
MAQRFVVSNLDASVYQSPNGHMDPWYIIGMEGPWKPRYGNKKKSPAAKDPATKLPTFTMWSFQTLNKTCRFFHQNSRVVTCLSFYFLVDAEEPYCCKIVCHSKKIWWYKPYTSINTLLVHFFLCWIHPIFTIRNHPKVAHWWMSEVSPAGAELCGVRMLSDGFQWNSWRKSWRKQEVFTRYSNGSLEIWPWIILG